MLGWNSKAAKHGLGPTGLIANPFSRPRWKFQSCDRLRYIAGSAATGLGPANASRQS